LPYRDYNRTRMFLLPPSLDDFVPEDHPARFVAEFVDSLDLEALGISSTPEVEGRPSYPPQLLLNCWLYGFMTRQRSSRQLERACTENVAFMWLTGYERPDHNTLWRFYRRYREAMRGLFRQTVRLAVEVELVDFALQAVDGTKIAGSAASRRMLDRAALQEFERQVEASITAVEQENAEEEASGPPSWRLPKGLKDRERLRQQVREGMARLTEEPARRQVNLGDLDARLMKGPHGYLTGYNVQAVVDGAAGILMAGEVTTSGVDMPFLVPMVQQAAANGGRLPEQVVADTGYYSGANLVGMSELGVDLVVPPQPPSNRTQDPAWAYHASHFLYDPATDSFTCPQGAPVVFSRLKPRRGVLVRVYRARGCPHCPVRPLCTKTSRRLLEISPWESVTEAHQARMSRADARQLMAQRRQLIEPIFGIIKEILGLRRFLLRGLAGVQAEWALVATAYNLAKLYRLWWKPRSAAA
jgi:transposase